MVNLSFVEEVKDRASRLIPTAYMDIVEECTAPHLSIPTYEHVVFMCECANTRPDAMSDIVRALRRRISNEDPAAQHLTILLLGAMVKNCGLDFHVELCNQKGLLRDLVNIAANPPISARGMQAKEAALTLTLNLSVWFTGHPDPRCHILSTLANDVREVAGPNAFEGIRPDSTTQMRLSVASPKNRRAENRRNVSYADPHNHHGSSDPRRKENREKRVVVEAIPIDLPKDDTVAAMLDACVAFSEYLNNSEVKSDGSFMFDEVQVSFQEKVQADHDYVSILLSSNLQVDRDVLRSISDSQSAVLNLLTRGRPASTGTTTATMPVAARQIAAPSQPIRAAADIPDEDAVPGSAVTPNCPAPVNTSAAPMDAFESFVTAPGATDVAPRNSPPKAMMPGTSPTRLPTMVSVPAPAVAPPSIDDIFGPPVTSASPPQSPSSFGNADASTNVPVVTSPLGVTTDVIVEEGSVSLVPASRVAAGATALEHPAETQESTADEAADEREKEESEAVSETHEEHQGHQHQQREASSEHDTSLVLEDSHVGSTINMPAAAQPEEASAAPVNAAAPVKAKTAVEDEDDDDFDAFLDGRVQ